MFSEGAGGDFNVLLKVGGGWYTTSDRLSKTLSAEWDLFVSDLTTASWLRLPNMAVQNASADSPTVIPSIADGIATASLSGNVEAFGLLFENTLSAGFNIDNYQIYVIPEPRAYAILFGLGAVLWVVLRRRRR